MTQLLALVEAEYKREASMNFERVDPKSKDELKMFKTCVFVGIATNFC